MPKLVPRLSAEHSSFPVICFCRPLCSFGPIVLDKHDHLKQTHVGVELISAVFRRIIPSVLNRTTGFG